MKDIITVILGVTAVAIVFIALIFGDGVKKDDRTPEQKVRQDRHDQLQVEKLRWEYDNRMR